MSRVVTAYRTEWIAVKFVEAVSRIKLLQILWGVRRKAVDRYKHYTTCRKNACADRSVRCKFVREDSKPAENRVKWSTRRQVLISSVRVTCSGLRKLSSRSRLWPPKAAATGLHTHTRARRLTCSVQSPFYRPACTALFNVYFSAIITDCFILSRV